MLSHEDNISNFEGFYYVYRIRYHRKMFTDTQTFHVQIVFQHQKYSFIYFYKAPLFGLMMSHEDNVMMSHEDNIITKFHFSYITYINMNDLCTSCRDILDMLTIYYYGDQHEIFVNSLFLLLLLTLSSSGQSVTSYVVWPLTT